MGTTSANTTTDTTTTSADTTTNTTSDTASLDTTTDVTNTTSDTASPDTTTDVTTSSASEAPVVTIDDLGATLDDLTFVANYYSAFSTRETAYLNRIAYLEAQLKAQSDVQQSNNSAIVTFHERVRQLKNNVPSVN